MRASRLVLVSSLVAVLIGWAVREGARGSEGLASAGAGASASPHATAARVLYATVGIGVIRDPQHAKKPGRIVTEPIEDFFPGPKLIARDWKWPGDTKALPRCSANYGAGVLFQRPDVVLTSARLVRDARSILLFGPFARGTSAEIAVLDTQTGLALLRTKRVVGEGDLHPAGAVQVGDDLLVAGCPQALDPSLARAMVSAADRRVAEAPAVPALQLHGLPPLGYEGAPAFTASGELVGITMSWPVYLDPYQTLRLNPGGDDSYRAAPVTPEGDVAFVVPIVHPAVWKRLVGLAQGVP